MKDFQLSRLVTLTLDRVILNTVMHHSSTTTYMTNFVEIEETSCGWMDRRTFVCKNGQTDKHLRPTLLGRLRWVNQKKSFSIVN